MSFRQTSMIYEKWVLKLIKFRPSPWIYFLNVRTYDNVFAYRFAFLNEEEA